MKQNALLLLLLILIFSCKKKSKDPNPQSECLLPTELIVKSLPNEDIYIGLLGADSTTTGKVSWTIIGPERTIQIETTGKISITQKFAKLGEFRVTAIFETICKSRITLTRTEIIKTPSLKVDWTKYLGTYTDTTFRAIVESGEGGCVVAGTVEFDGISRLSNTTIVCKIDARGSVVWKKEIIEANSFKRVVSIVRSNDSGYLIGIDGYPYSYEIIKISKGGDLAWRKNFHGGINYYYDRLTMIANASDDGYILAGHSSSGIGSDKSQAPRNPKVDQNYTYTDFWVIKIDNSGNRIWDKVFGGESEDVLKNIVNTPDGGYALIGQSYSTKSGDKTDDSIGALDGWIVKINKSGIKEWDKSIEGNIFDAISLSDGAVVLSKYPKIYENTLTYLKITANGQIAWLKTTNGIYAKLLPNMNGKFSMLGYLSDFKSITFDNNGEITNSTEVSLVNLANYYQMLWTTTREGDIFGVVSTNESAAIIHLKYD